MAEKSNDFENLRQRRVNLEDLPDAGSELATRVWYKLVFKREFGFVSTFSFAVSISGLFSTVVTTFSYLAKSIAVLAMCDNRYDPRYVFTDIVSTSGWDPVGFSWLFGLLSVWWTISNPEMKAQQAFWLAMLFSYFAGFLINIVWCFVMGDITEVLSSPTAQPVAQIFYHVLGRVGGIIFTFCAFLIIKFVTFTAMQSLGIKINGKTQIPLYAVCVSVFCVVAINLIGLNSYIRIAGVFNATAIALGKFSFAVNAWALPWTIFVTIIFLLPTFRPLTANTMNYASSFLGGVIALSATFWLAGGKSYTGPLIVAEVAKTGSKDIEDGSRSGSDLTREAQRPADNTA
ncbi:MAG: hypothetical protein Q9184_007379 [Pyrenodesmia sp. 2 TL-2023]